MTIALPRNEASAAWKSYNFHPPDPAWTPTVALETARRRLRAFDSRLSLWWSPMRRAAEDWDRPGRWRVVEWLPNQGNWTTAFYWEGPSGEYREPLPVEPIIQKLQSIQVSTVQADLQAEHATNAANATRKADFQAALREHFEDHFARDQGIRQTFAPGYIRRRQVKRSDIANTNFKRYLRSQGVSVA